MSEREPSTKARNWDAVAALIAALIGLLALCVSAYTASIQRQQVRAQVWTQLMFANSDTDQTLLVLNKGVGPARLESARFFVDGKAQTDWDRVFAALGVTHQGELRQSSVNSGVIAANERLEYMKLVNAEDWKAFRAQRGRLKARYCYCSVLDECRVFDQRAPRREDADTAVASCERSADEEFTE